MELSEAFLITDDIALDKLSKKEWLSEEAKIKIEVLRKRIHTILNIKENTLLSKEDIKLWKTYINKYDI
jgi:hypothetical protein